MNNREKDNKTDSYHLYIALRRKKENRDLKELCLRQIIRDENLDLNLLKEKIKGKRGVWRIYKTVNKRLVNPALKIMMKMLIDEPDKFSYRIDSLWKNCLLKKECRKDRKFLVDIDNEVMPTEIEKLIDNRKINVEEKIKTPNGWHLICKKLDTRLIRGIKDVGFKRDEIKFVEIIKK
jgi:hypothetical protein